MTRLALYWSILIEFDGFTVHDFDHVMAFVASDSLVTAFQRKLGFAVIKSRGLPALGIVAVGAPGLSGSYKLACVDILVTIFTNLGRTFELYLFGSRRNLVAVTALYRAMRAQQRKLRLRMVEAADVGPGPRIVARFAAKRSAIRPALRHTIFELAMVNIFMTTCTGHVFENKGQDLIGSASGTHFVTIRTRHSRMRAG